MKVEADLTDRGARRVPDQLLEPAPSRLVHLPGVMGVDTDRRLDERTVERRQLERPFRGCNVPSGDEDALDPGLDRPFEHRAAVGIELRMLEVTVRVDQAGEPPARSSRALRRRRRAEPT